jgi:hypothetical protein
MMEALPSYPSDREGQLQWYATFERILNEYMFTIYSACLSYTKRPMHRVLNETYTFVKEMILQADEYLVTAVNHVKESKYSSIDSIVDMLEQMRLRISPRIIDIRNMYIRIKYLYFKALPPLPDVEIPTTERFCIP